MCLSHYYCYWVFLVFGGDKKKSKKNVESKRTHSIFLIIIIFWLIVRTSHWLIDCVGQSLPDIDFE